MNKGMRRIALIILAIIALLYTIWCLVDGTYYLAIFGMFILGSLVYNFISIKRRSNENK